MKLIIDIPEDVYNDMIKLVKVDGNIDRLVDVAIVNGTPLEKHDEEIIKETVASVWGNPPYTEVLDKIRVELHATAEMHEDNVYYLREEWIDEIINKYKMGG